MVAGVMAEVSKPNRLPRGMRRAFARASYALLALAGACELVMPLGPPPSDDAGGSAGTRVADSFGGGPVGSEAGSAAIMPGGGGIAGASGAEGGAPALGSAGTTSGRGPLEVGGPAEAGHGSPPAPATAGNAGRNDPVTGDGAAGNDGAAGDDGGGGGAGAGGAGSGGAGAGGTGSGGAGNGGAAGAGSGGSGATSSDRPSCRGQALACGVSNDDCCASELVPGGTFSFGSGAPTIATIDSFYFDTFEVTVGRFRAFLAGYDAWRATGNPSAGFNTLPHVTDSGWQSAWDELLPRDAATFEAALVNCSGSTANSDTSLPINCLSWEEAFAFCAWDGGRLPTSVEWEYALVAGPEYRPAPWGTEPLSHARAIYNCLGDEIDGCSPDDIVPVGSKPLGKSKWGQYDLFGSMYEWIFDYAGDYPAICDNCALIDGDHRTMRGGAWYDEEGYLDATRRDYMQVWQRDSGQGLRCARALE